LPTASCESADNRSNERSLPIDLVCDGRTQAEILILRHQLNVLRRKFPKRVAVGSIDRLLFVGLYRFSPKVLDALKILKPETVLRWHRAGFRTYWRWKSRSCGGRPKTPVDIRHIIREMSVAKPLWRGATDTRRTAQVWHRRRPDDRSKLHGKEKATTVAAGRPSFAIMLMPSRR
jgi:hypothetical protein